MKTKPIKIVATIGPASHSEENILELAKAGVDVFRINFSHATSTEAIERVTWIRKAEKHLGRPLAIMGDLPGPKIRISEVKPDTILQKGQKFLISKNISEGDQHGCGLNFPSIIDVLEPGAEVFVDDGTLKLIVDKKMDDAVETIVLVGGLLKPRKGFSAEGLSLTNHKISEKDKAAIKLMVEHKTDALAVSFVQSAKDIRDVRELLPENSQIMLIAKIETANGVENAEDILEEADGMMVARGDLGLAIPIAKVPHIQKQLIDLCIRKAKPVITATQMLESMISKPIPTRAEVADVANAILDGSDAIMLSAETAEGKFPVETVEMMVKIIHESIKYLKPLSFEGKNTISNATGASVGAIADRVEARLVIAFTHSGRTARRIARHRHPQVIVAVSPEMSSVRKLNFSWGVHPQIIERTKDFEDMLHQAREIAKTNTVEPLEKNDLYVISAGMPFDQTGTTNMILVQKV
ncbi:MAG TPA: pyruvate kinase [Candidatus Sulfotelmatobacter sp.]|jgi:pyruvate kinase|nr:pyruvate kinase [Candidatus Sulfotelmatobacter sp.]